MQEIDAIWFLYPVLTIGFSFGTIWYWRKRNSSTSAVLGFSLAAYSGAIILKEVVQLLTLGPFEALVSGNLLPLGIYFGAQTVAFEVGGAYLVASLAVSRRRLNERDAVGYGLGLAFWENGVLLGIITLINYTSYYAILASGSSGLPQLVYNTLVANEPALFYSPGTVLPLVSLAILERLSSLLIHLSWGCLTLLAAFYRRRLYLAVALPMGMIDALVPFAPVMGDYVFEAVILMISVACLAFAMALTSNVRKAPGTTAAAPAGSTGSTSL